MTANLSTRAASAVLCAGLTLWVMPVHAQQPCAGFSWNVSRELALFAGEPATLTAGTDGSAAPLLSIGRLYRLQLRPVADVHFAAAPGKRNGLASGFAGLAALEIGASGKYRFAVDAPFWIDVVTDGGLMQASGHQGDAGCSGPHKLVEFDLPAAGRLLLQFSGASDDSVRVTVTAVAH
jgi:hypothetical protein